MEAMSTRPRGSFRYLDHTADAGIVVTAPTLGVLFETAAFALTELITNVDGLKLEVERQIQLEENEIETLLVSWLQELLYLLDTEQLVFGRFQVNVTDCFLDAQVWGEPFNSEIHTSKTEIKAVTYHQLEVIESDQGWKAKVIFDI
jgi:SHS2 domain-containing protein